MMRRAGAADLPAIRACLGARPELAMFPLSNLASYGLDGDHDHAPSFWVNPGDIVTDVLTLTRAGMVMPFLPSGDTGTAAEVVRGRAILGVIGPAAHARPLAEALGVREAACSLSRDEPQFALDLADLIVPEVAGTLVSLEQADRARLERWRADYDVEALGMDRARAEAEGRDEIARYIARDSHRALVVDGVPVAMTGFNARLPEIVQVGAVYTPPDLRRRGHARRAVALHLAEARAAGVRRATLFAASENAARAYVAIGFRRIGDWSLILCREPCDV